MEFCCRKLGNKKEEENTTRPEGMMMTMKPVAGEVEDEGEEDLLGRKIRS